MAVTTLARPAIAPTLRSICARGDDVRHADRHDRDGRGLPDDVQQVVAGEEALVAERDREEQEHHDEADVDDVAAPVEIGERVFPLGARRWMEVLRSGSWSDSLDGELEGFFVGDVARGRFPCRSRPSRSTRMRSLTASSSGSSEEMTMTPLPASARSRIMSRISDLGADVDAGGGLVHDQHLRVGAEPLGDARPSAGCRPRAAALGRPGCATLT